MKQRKNPQPSAPTGAIPKTETVAQELPTHIPYTQRNVYTVLGIMAVCSVIVYYQGMFNDFTWDARRYVLDNPYFPKLLSEGAAWFKDTKYGVFSAFELGNYHPITNFTWALEYMLVGKSHWLYVVTQTLLHIANSYLVFRVIHRLHPNFLVAAITGILFAIHPLHVESVVWVAERKDTLYMLFMLLSFDYYIRWWQSAEQQNKKAFWAAVFMFFLACFSKAMAVVLPVVFLLTDITFFKRKIGFNLILEKWAYWVLAIITGLLSIYVQKEAGADATSQINSQFTLWERTLIIAFNFSFYWFKMLIPTGLRAFYSYPNKPLPNEFYAALLSTPAIIYALYHFGKTNSKILWGGAFFFIVILPVIQILPIGSAIVADRYFYASSVGPLYLCGLGGAYLYESRPSLRQTFLFVGGALTLLFTYMSWDRIKVWKDDLALFTNVFEAYPTNGFIAGNIGWAYSQKKDSTNVIKWFEKAGELNWNTDEIHNTLGSYYAKRNEHEKAINNYRQALELKPKSENLKNLYWQIGTEYYHLKDNKSAIEWSNKALSTDPKNFFAHNVLGLIYTRTQEYDKGIYHLEQAIKFNPKYYDPYVNLGHIYSQMGQNGREIPLLIKAIKIDPKAPLAYKNIGVAFKAMNNWQKAVEYWKMGAKNVSDDGSFDYNVGLEYGQHGNIPEGIVWMRSAVRKNYPIAREFLTLRNIPLQ